MTAWKARCKIGEDDVMSYTVGVRRLVFELNLCFSCVKQPGEPLQHCRKLTCMSCWQVADSTR
jgi:hypothetical protein